MVSIMKSAEPPEEGNVATGWVPVWARSVVQAGVFPVTIAVLVYVIFVVFSRQLDAHAVESRAQAAEQTRLLHAICTGVGSQITDPVRRDAAMARCDEVK